MSYEIITRTFDTILGRIKTSVQSDCKEIKAVGDNQYNKGRSKTFKTTGYEIELIEFKIRQPLYNGMTVMDSLGWIFRIKKINDSREQLSILCSMDNPTQNLNHGPDSGEHLDSIEIWDNEKQWKINIGTEDGEMLKARAEVNDWMPTRLSSKFGFDYSPTDYIPYGFNTKVPDLEKDELIYFQYLVAIDKYDEQNISTWFAVDEFKRNLENYIGVW